MIIADRESYGALLAEMIEPENQDIFEDLYEAALSFGPVETLNENLVYLAGRAGHLQRIYIEGKIDTPHPVFGFAKHLGPVTGMEAFLCGFHDITLQKLRENYKFYYNEYRKRHPAKD